MKNTILVSGDQNKYLNTFTDLVSNSDIFKKEYDDNALLSLPNWPDNSDYSHYPTLQEVIQDYDPEKDKNKSFVCRVSDKFVFSSCANLDGYDRPNNVDYKKCHAHLNEKINGNSEVKGFNDEDADVLHGKIRFAIQEDGKILLFLVKNKGNHRFVMKALAHRGEYTEHLFKLKFHDIYSIEDLAKYDAKERDSARAAEEYFKISESDGHFTDAQLRTSQNEVQKFTAGLSARKSDFIECYNFLLENKLNFKPTKEHRGVMQIKKVDVTEGKPEGMEEWINISSIQLLNEGITNGAFKKYGIKNIEYAIKTIQRNVQYTKETTILNSVILSIASAYQSFTTDQTKFGNKPGDVAPKKVAPAFTVDDLDKFFDKFIKSKSKLDEFEDSVFKFNSLTMTKNIKNREVIFLKIFFRNLSTYHKNINKHSIKMLTQNHKNTRHFLKKISGDILCDKAREYINIR